MNNNLKIPNNWIEVSLGDIIFNQKGKKPNIQQGGEFEGSIPYLDIKAFEKKEIRRFSDKDSSVEIDENDLAIVWDGSRSGWVGKGLSGALGSTLVKIKSFLINSDYLYHFIDTQYSYINNNTKGTGIPHVNPDVLWNMKIPLPPLEEQNRIAFFIEELFSDLDNGISNLKFAQSKLKTYKQVVLKEAFKGAMTSEWREKNNPEPAHKLLKQIKKDQNKKYIKDLNDWKDAIKLWQEKNKKDKKPRKPTEPIISAGIKKNNKESLSNLPRNIIWTNIGYIAKIEMGQSPPGDTYNSEGIGTPLINGPAEFGKGPFSKTQKVKWTTKATKLCDEGDLLICVRGSTTGRQNIAGFEACIGRGVCSVKSLGVLQKYLNHFFNYSNNKIFEMGTGTTFPSISKDQLINFKIPLYSLDEQLLIVEMIETQFSIIDDLTQIINSNLQKANALRHSILKKAFEGRLVEQKVNDESASQLLQKIIIQKKEYIDKEKTRKKSTPKKIKKMSKKLSIEEVLKTSNKPMLARDVWQQSIHKESIEEFYSELKKIQAKIKEVKKGTESLLVIKA